MELNNVSIDRTQFTIGKADVIVVGSGAAALNAAIQCKQLGMQDIVILTERLGAGVTANAGSDKQTYYRVNPGSANGDSYLDMATALFEGGCMHGDIALIEASLSQYSFFHLVGLGVSFPHNRYGDYVGFKTDHDKASRGSSAGPETSITMYRKLLDKVNTLGIPIIDNMEIIEICAITEEKKKKAAGVLAIDKSKIDDENFGLTAYCSNFIVYGAGGPGALFKDSVYPQSQIGSLGIALKAGAAAQNLTEMQFGIASLKFRWNLSGSYQQVLPRYFSCEKDGSDEREFLNYFFPSTGQALLAQFLKGYQWPFDVRKVDDFGSSCIDMLVYYETKIRNRKVYLDYTNNPQGKDATFSLEAAPSEVRDYLRKSNAMGETPIERLKQMNCPAYELYKKNGIDLELGPLEIAVCNQHFNGGLAGSIWWESSIENFFPVGECAGSHGIYRPGGSALNAGQVGGVRSAQCINARKPASDREKSAKISYVAESLEKKFDRLKSILSPDRKLDPARERKKIQERMSGSMGIIRNSKSIKSALNENARMIEEHRQSGARDRADIPPFLRNKDMLITEKAILENACELLSCLRGSRGSYFVGDLEKIFVTDSEGQCVGIAPVGFDGSLNNSVFVTSYGEDGIFHTEKTSARPIPESDDWFESVWRQYRNGEIYNN